MAMQLFKEKREHPRLDLNCLVRTRDEFGKSQQHIGINYSLRGMALQTRTQLALGEFIELFFRIDEYKTQEFNMTAEVMQNYKSGNVYITGVKFLGELPINN